MTEERKMEIYEKYSRNNMSKLKSVTKMILDKFGGIYDLHNDDFYSIANQTLWQATENYDETKNDNFEAYLIICLRKRFMSFLTKINKTAAVSTGRAALCIDFKNEDGSSIGEIIPSSVDVERSALDKYGLSENVLNYVNSFYGNSRKVIDLYLDGYSNEEIIRKLNLNRREFNDIQTKLRSYKHAHLLYGSKNNGLTEKKETSKMTDLSFNQSKQDKYSVSVIKKRIERGELSIDYALQRDENQWTNEGKSNQISDMLQQYPFPELVFAQKVTSNGVPITYVIDGKQRITNALTFIRGGFKISKKVRRGVIRYVSGSYYDENGEKQSKVEEFDIRGKSFDDLPETLKDILTDYCFNVTVYLNCSDEDIAYHITRYNDGKAMNANQKSILRIGNEFAKAIDDVTKAEFFNDGKFKTSDEQKSALKRICIEAVMASNHLDDWKKKPEQAAEYLANNGNFEEFAVLKEDLGRIQKLLTTETKKLFSVKDAHIWIAAFNRFKDLNVDDNYFGRFLKAFVNDLHTRKIDNVSYDDICEQRNSKDKKIVSNKIEHLYTLMAEYIGEKNSVQYDKAS